MTAFYEIGNVRNKKNPKVYLKGQIMVGGTQVSEIYGNYMGYICLLYTSDAADE